MGDTMPKEIEIRNKLFNEDELLNFFKDKGVKIYKQSHQVDTYFDNEENSFFKDINHVIDWIRLRDEDGVLSFNYKHWLPEGAEIRTYCEEKEFIMKSKEEFNIILSRLGFKGTFKPVVVVDKIRTSFMYRDCEIAIDRIKDLGTFIELEYKGKKENVLEIQNLLNDVLKSLPVEIGPSDHKGHAYHLFLANKNKLRNNTIV